MKTRLPAHAYESDANVLLCPSASAIAATPALPMLSSSMLSSGIEIMLMGGGELWEERKEGDCLDLTLNVLASCRALAPFLSQPHPRRRCSCLRCCAAGKKCRSGTRQTWVAENSTSKKERRRFSPLT